MSIFLQRGMNVISIPYTWGNPYKVIFVLKSVNDDVLRFVWELTERRWFYSYHYMRRYLMIFDRWTDIEFIGLLALYHHESFPHYEVCLGLFVILHLISFALYSNTKLFKSYAVRTVIPTIISGVFCCEALSTPCVLAWKNDVLVMLPICQNIARGSVYIVVLIKVYRQLDIVDVVFELKEDRWVHRYHVNRSFLVIFDHLFNILVIGLFALYYLKSIPYWPIVLLFVSSLA